MRPRPPGLPLVLTLAVWLALATALAALTSKVADWFVMTDELLYERLALSIARTHSLLPRVHEQAVSNLNQLYPLVIAPLYRSGGILHGFHQAHVVNAFVMTSAAIPSYLLARRVTQCRWLPLFAAIATITVPWITLSSFLLTEVVAYPAFMWAVLAMHTSITRPSLRNDALALAAIVLAVLARTQFYALAGILPAAIVVVGLAERRLRETLRQHRALVGAYAFGLLAAALLSLSGHSPLGSYSTTVSGNPFPWRMVESVPAHLSIVALAGGLLPFLIGGAWLVINVARSDSRERLAFAGLAVVTIVVLTVEVASFDLRFGGGIVRDRYLFYVTPLLLVATVAALSAERRPRWSVAVPLAILALGFWRAPLPPFEKLNVDTPASVINNWLLSTMQSANGARAFLALAALVCVLLLVQSSALLSRPSFAATVCVLLLVALPLESAYAFKRLFAVNGTSGLPLTLDQSNVFSWVDRAITTNSEAVIVPYPIIRTDYNASIAFWWDLEFWNKSVDREAGRPNEFWGTPPGTFPKIDLRFDEATGRANFDVDSYVAQAAADARFHVKGRFLTTERGVSIVFPDRPWRADWVSYGLYADGWTRPNEPARIRVFADPKQTQPALRTVTLSLAAPDGSAPRPTALRSNAGNWKAEVTSSTITQEVRVCVPRIGYADIALRSSGSSPIYGDPSTPVTFSAPREAGVLVAHIELAGGLTTNNCPKTP